MLCIQPTWIMMHSSRHENKIHKARSIESFFNLEESSSEENSPSMNNQTRRKSEKCFRTHFSFLDKQKRISESDDEISFESRSSSVISSDQEMDFDTSYWQHHCWDLEKEDVFYRKTSIASTASNSSKKSSHKLKNIIDWVQKSGRRASIKYKSLKRKGSISVEDGGKMRCSDNSRKSLHAVLHDKDSTKAFREYLLKEMSEENLDFWLEVESFKKQKSSKQEKLAKKIYDTYIAVSSASELNIDAKVRKQTKENLKNPGQDTFESAQEQIFKLMETDSYRRFCLQINSF